MTQFIEVAKGNTLYGYIAVCIKKRKSAPNIYVFHDDTEAALYEDREFCEMVIGLLVDHDKLEADKRYRLERAPLSLQGARKAVYKALYRYDELISKEFCLANGGVDILDIEAETESDETSTEMCTEYSVLLQMSDRTTDTAAINNFHIASLTEQPRTCVVSDGVINNVKLVDVSGTLCLLCDCNDFLASQCCLHVIAVAKRVLDPSRLIHVEEREFFVSVNRIGYSTRVIKVRARSERQASVKALNTAGDHSFSEHDSRYECEYVKEVAPR